MYLCMKVRDCDGKKLSVENYHVYYTDNASEVKDLIARGKHDVYKLSALPKIKDINLTVEEVI